MGNGENTAHKSNREFLASRGLPGYEDDGCQSDCAVFTHTLHYIVTRLEMGVDAFKHVITPLDGDQLRCHPDAVFLTHLKHACRHLSIDGPNCVVGCLPDNTLFMAQDGKKLRPGIVGGFPGKFAFASEACGLDAVIPERDHRHDYQPMHQDTVVAGPVRKGLTIFKQSDPLLAN